MEKSEAKLILRILSLILIHVFLLVICLQICTASEDEYVPQTVEELAVKVDSIRIAHQIPGLGVAVVARDSIVWIGCFGYANVETGAPMTDSTLFRVESCTKSFTGLGFLKMVEDGIIDLNTPVQGIVLDIEIRNPWRDTHPVRVIHLLEHTASFDDITPSWMVNNIDPEMSPKRALQLKAVPMKVRWKPGTRYAYSGRGYTLAGYVIETITGQRYEDYLKENILLPIGMTNSTLRVTEDSQRLMAQGYDKNNMPVPYTEGYDRPASSLLTSTKDMARFVQFLLNEGKVDTVQVLTKESIDRLGFVTTTLAAQAGLTEGYAFGVGASPSDDGVIWYNHSGGGIGFLSQFAYLMDHGIGMVLLLNQFNPSGYYAVDDLVTKFVLRDIEVEPEPPAFHLSSELLAQYTGYYQCLNPRQQLTQFINIIIGGVTISLANDTLYTQGFLEAKKPILPVSETMFRRPDQNRATSIFTTTSEGKMVYAPRRDYYQRTGHWKLYVNMGLFFGAWILMISTIPYGLVWIPVHLVKKFKRNENRSKYIRMRMMPLVTVVTLFVGFLVLADQTMLSVCQLTWQNVVNYMLVLLFVPFSVLSLIFALLSFRKPVKKFARIYALLVSISLVGMSVYLSIYGVIGMRNWAD